jgi:hypothetical protein
MQPPTRDLAANRIQRNRLPCGNGLNFFVTSAKVTNPFANQLADTIGFDVSSGMGSLVHARSRPEVTRSIST